MSYYAYCVVRLDHDEPWEVFPGIADRPVFAVRDQKMAVLVSRLDRPHLEDVRSVVQHGQVIHRVFERRTVLPFRYGTVFAAQVQVETLLRENRDQFTETIRFLRGKAEMHVKVVLEHAARPRAMAMAAAAGGSLFHAPSQAAVPNGNSEEDARFLAQRIAEMLRPLQEQMSLRPGREGQMLLDLRHLVEDERIPAYQKLPSLATERVRDCQVQVQVQVTGPWPPYHFLPVAVKLPARSERSLRGGERLLTRARGMR